MIAKFHSIKYIDLRAVYSIHYGDK